MNFLVYFILLPFLYAIPTESDSFSSIEDDHAAPLRVPSNSPVPKIQNLEELVLAKLKIIEAEKEVERLLTEFAPIPSLISFKRPTHLAEEATPLLGTSQGKIFKPRQGKVFNSLAGFVPLNHEVPPENTIPKEDWEQVLRLLEEEDSQSDKTVKKSTNSPAHEVQNLERSILGRLKRLEARKEDERLLADFALPPSVFRLGRSTNLAQEARSLLGIRQEKAADSRLEKEINGNDIEIDAKLAGALSGQKRPHSTKDLENVIESITSNQPNPHENDILPEERSLLLQAIEKKAQDIELSSGTFKKHKSSLTQAEEAANRFFIDNGIAEHSRNHIPLQDGNYPKKTITTDEVVRVLQNSGDRHSSPAIVEKIMEAVPRLL